MDDLADRMNESIGRGVRAAVALAVVTIVIVAVRVYLKKRRLRASREARVNGTGE